ncbi:hypothetical protein [Halopenitus persicus]|uniref:Uncharacterized protein n=1 Tax=Halopenitus persicus TaxID=1048396 RepID=A0A1H3ILU2_9EURY|nr:hypothetical protein [Halopenitus persicus]SDY27794.1 hypothetical protein SAMN05216564_104150 [Halopenitus persicus]
MTPSGTSRVKRTLELLAARSDTDRPPYLAVIDEADAARRDLERAAGFLESVGLDRLDAAIESAAADGATDAADRGRAARSAYRDLRRAAAGDAAAGDAASGDGGAGDAASDDVDTGDGTAGDAATGGVAGDDRSGDADSARRSDRDHFHPGGGTAKRRTAQGSRQ